MDDPPFTTPGLSLKRAEATDIPSIQSIINEAYSKYIPRMNKTPAPMSTDYQALLTSPTYTIFVLRSSDEDIVGAFVLYQEENAKNLRINNMVVDPKAQGRGYGRVLMQYAEDVAKWRGCTALTLYTNLTMVENLVLYPKMGFMESERRTEDGFQRVYFRKELV